MERESNGETLWDPRVEGWLTNSRPEAVDDRLADEEIDTTGSGTGKRRLSMGGASEPHLRSGKEGATGTSLSHGRSSVNEAGKRVRQKTFSSDADECAVAMEEQHEAEEIKQMARTGEDDGDDVVATGGALKVPVKVVLMGKRIAFMCTLCKAMCNNGDNLVQHLRGKKHGNRERKALQARLISSAPQSHSSPLGPNSAAVASGSQAVKESASGMAASMDSDCFEVRKDGEHSSVQEPATASGSIPAHTPSSVDRAVQDYHVHELSGNQLNPGRRKAGKRQQKPLSEQNRVEGKRRKPRAPRNGNEVQYRARKTQAVDASIEGKLGGKGKAVKGLVRDNRAGEAVSSGAATLVHAVAGCEPHLASNPEFAMVVFIYDETVGRGRDWRVAFSSGDSEVSLLSRGEDGGDETWLGGVAALQIENHVEPTTEGEAMPSTVTQQPKKALQLQLNSEEAAFGDGSEQASLPASSSTGVKRGRGGGRGGGRGTNLVLLRERTCFICRKMMEVGEEVAALLNVTQGEVACKSRNRQGFFHVFHKDCLHDWVCLCLRRAAMTEEAQTASPHSAALDTRSGKDRMMVQWPKEASEPAEGLQQDGAMLMRSHSLQLSESSQAVGEGIHTRSQEAQAGAAVEDETLVPWGQAGISGPFCPECQGTGIESPDGELEHPRHRLNQVFGWILELVQARKLTREATRQKQQNRSTPTVAAYAAGSPELFAALEGSRSSRQMLMQE